MTTSIPQPATAEPREPWTFARVVRVMRTGVRLGTNIPSQIEILRCLSHPVLSELLRKHWRIPFKFAGDNFLVRGFTVQERKACFLHHYTRLSQIFPDTLLRQLLLDRIALFEAAENEERYRVTMHFSHSSDKEGELTLNLDADGKDLYVISFTIVPGEIVKSGAPEVLLVTRVQGMRGEFRAIQQATKALHDVAPPAVLMAALQGFGEAVGVREVVGISALRQSAYNEQYKDVFFRSYDEFFLDVGLAEADDQLYRSPIPIPEKPMQDVKRGHKLRTKEKRAFKREVGESVRQYFEQSWCVSNDYGRVEQPMEFPVQSEW